jgi:ubiquinone biosynthesis protein COQ9
MLDDLNNRSKAIKAAMELAQERGWYGFGFADVAERSGLSLAQLRREFPLRIDLLKGFQAEVDAAVLEKQKMQTPEQSPRDRLFDVVMMRFEAMAPYKPALKRISRDLCCRPDEGATLACSGFVSQYWMLTAAGISVNGASGCLRVTGLSGIYARVFSVWLDDDTPGLDRTMAALDRRLTKAEDWLNCFEDACGKAIRFACGLLPRGWRRTNAPKPGDAGQPATGAV